MRDGDLFKMNNANTFGKLHCKRDMGSYQVAEADLPSDDDQKAEPSKKKGTLESFKDQLYDKSGTLQATDGALEKIGDYWNTPSLIGQDAMSAWDALPTPGEAEEYVLNVGEGIANTVQNVWNDPLGSANATGGWLKDQVTGGWEGVKDVYAQDGVSGTIGAAFGKGIDLINPGKKLKMAGEAVEAAGDAGKAAKKLDGKDNKKNNDGTESSNETSQTGRITAPPKRPNKRHDPCRTKGKDYTKEKNSMIDPDYKDAIDKDVTDIIDGKVDTRRNIGRSLCCLEFYEILSESGLF